MKKQFLDFEQRKNYFIEESDSSFKFNSFFLKSLDGIDLQGLVEDSGKFSIPIFILKLEYLRAYYIQFYGSNLNAYFFEVKNAASYNIIASINPEASKRVLIAAHWDSRLVADKDDKDKNKPIDGADDGGGEAVDGTFE